MVKSVFQIEKVQKNFKGDGTEIHLLQDMSSSPGDSHEDSEGEGGGEEGDPHKCHSWGSWCKNHWKEIFILICLWMAYFICNSAYSIVYQVFPSTVSLHNHKGVGGYS